MKKNIKQLALKIPKYDKNKFGAKFHDYPVSQL